MITASELAGFIAAHAIWCISEADGLIPMVAHSDIEGKRTLERMMFEDVGAAIEQGRQRLDDASSDAMDGVLAFDGRIGTDAGKLDAIILEMRSYAFPGAKATLAVPYSPVSSGAFRVHKPKLLEWENCDDFDLQAAFLAFFRGFESHEKGAEVWNAALDESK
jgi:hypothetical protein